MPAQCSRGATCEQTLLGGPDGRVAQTRTSETLQGLRLAAVQVRARRPGAARRPYGAHAAGARRRDERPGRGRGSSPPTSRRSGRPSSSSASSSPPAPTSCRRPTSRRWRACRTASSRSRSREVEEIVCDRARRAASPRRSRDFDPSPLAAASLAQVHRAALRDGREVAVKVQRPGIREQVLEDLEALAEIAALPRQAHRVRPALRFEQMFEEFRKSLLRELDYRQEALQPRHPRAQPARSIERDLSCPQPVDDYTHLARADDGVRRRHKITDAQPARAHRARRRAPGRRAVPRLPQADPARRLLPRRSASGQRVRRRTARSRCSTSAWWRASTPALQEQLLQLLLAVSRQPAPTTRPRTLLADRRRREDADAGRASGAAWPTSWRSTRTSRSSSSQVGRAVLDAARGRRPRTASACRPSSPCSARRCCNLDEIGRTLDAALRPQRGDPAPRRRRSPRSQHAARSSRSAQLFSTGAGAEGVRAAPARAA